MTQKEPRTLPTFHVGQDVAIVGRMVTAEIVIRRSVVAHVTELNILLQDGSRWGHDGYEYRVKPEPSKFGLPPRYFEPRLVPGADKPRSFRQSKKMPQCKRCQAPIRWQKGRPPGPAWIALNQAEGTPHSCQVQKVCRYCQKPVLWKEHEGKRQCFEIDGTTLHNDVCAHRDECSHCGQKVRWTLIEGKWLALDPVMTSELHWGLCPKNPEAAKGLIARLARLAAENETLKMELVKCQREINYREVELRRLNQKAEGVTRG